MIKKYTQSKRDSLVKKIDQYRKDGLNATDACKKAGTSYGSYKTWTDAPGPKSKKAKKNNTPAPETFTIPEADDNVFFIYGKASNVFALADRLIILKGN